MESQLARHFVLALPKKVPVEQYPQMIRDYCEKQFVSKEMIADFASMIRSRPDTMLTAMSDPSCHG